MPAKAFAESLPESARRLLACCRPEPSSPVAADLLGQATLQGVAGLVLRPAAPAIARPWLLANAARALAITREARAICTMFEAGGIEPIFVKGPFLSARYYGDLGLRDAGDLDLLVAEDKVWHADALLQAAGYSRFKPRCSFSRARAEVYLNTQHEIGYWSPDRQLSVELHWRFADCRALQHATFSELLERSHELNVGPLQLRVLSTLDTFVHLAIHGSLIAWSRLKWIADLEFVQAALSGEECAALERLERAPAYGRMITLARSFAGAPAPEAEPWLAAALRHVVRQYETPDEPAPRRGMRHHRYLLSLIRGVGNRLAFLHANAIMPGDFDASRMPDYASALLPYFAFGRRVVRKALGAA